MDFKIDDNIPLPEDYRSGGSKWPFSAMEAGQSVFIPTSETMTPAKVRGAVSAIVFKRFVTRIVRENDTDGVRVWCAGRRSET